MISWPKYRSSRSAFFVLNAMTSASERTVDVWLQLAEIRVEVGLELVQQHDRTRSRPVSPTVAMSAGSTMTAPCCFMRSIAPANSLSVSA